MRGFVARLIGEGFRVFFLSAMVFAPLALGLWLLSFFAGVGAGVLPARIAPVDWHAHELVFGYGGAALAGFFLTAVPNWTGAKAARHIYIGTAAAIWLGARLAMLGADLVPPLAVAALDLGFAPFLGAKIAAQLVKKPKPQNMVFLLFLGFFWAGNLLVHLDWLGLAPGGAAQGMRAGLLSLVGMILVLGGRVAPAFTRNAMHREGIETGLPRDPAPFTPLAILLGLALPLVWLVAADSLLAAAVSLAAGVFALIRVTFWHTRFQWRQPIIWTLHLSYAAIGLGLALHGLALAGIGAEVAALHLLAIGGVAGMTVSVMTRASLGHSGRALVAPRGVAAAYVLVPLAALLRWAGGQLGGDAYTALTLAAGLVWCAAFLLILGAFWPVLTQPRAPRAPARPAPEN